MRQLIYFRGYTRVTWLINAGPDNGVNCTAKIVTPIKFSKILLYIYFYIYLSIVLYILSKFLSLR